MVNDPGTKHLRAVLRLFFLSGLSGILFEVLWTRIFTFLLGSSIQSMSAVVTAFMLGLGLGSYLLGQIADRKTNSLRIYGTLELGVAASGLVALLLFQHLEGLYTLLYARLAASVVKWLVFAVAFVFISIPATMIGGTMPVLARYAVESDDELKDTLGRLYTVNTLGAALGAVLMLLIVFAVGYVHGYECALGVNVITGLSALWLSRRESSGTTAAAAPTPVEPSAASAAAGRSNLSSWLLPVFAVSGFSALVYEVVWFRTFDFLLLGKLTTFAIVLATYLLGVSLGSLILSRWSETRLGDLGLFAVLEGLVGLMGIFSLPLMSWVTGHTDRSVSIGAFFLVIIAITFVLGGLFPLAGKLNTNGLQLLGRSIGSTYSANTLGSVLGSFLGGFLLIPRLGTERTYLLAALLNLAIALGVGYQARERISRSWRIALGTLSLAGMALWLLGGSWLTSYYEHTVIRPGYHIVEQREDELAAVMVAEDDEGDRVLMGGPFQSGETIFTRRQTQRLQAHLPMLLHPDPKQVLEIGYGVGEIARTVELYRPERLELVEIDENMIPMADRYFEALNGHASQQPNAHVELMDGRHYLRMTHDKFDVILSDSMILASEASLRLYTLEHFQAAREHLAPGGLMVVWLPMNVGVTKSLVIMKTFLQVFPQCLLWLPLGHNTQEAYLVGFRDQARVDLDAFAARYQNLAAPELHSFGWDDPALFFGSFHAGPERLAELTRDVSAVNRDMNPVLDFLPTEGPEAVNQLVRVLVSEDPAFVLAHAQAQSAAGRELLEHLPNQLAQLHQADAHFLDGVDGLERLGDVRPADLVAREPEVTSEFRKALEIFPNHRASAVWIAMVHDQVEQAQPPPETDRRRALLEEALKLDPTDLIALRALARQATDRGERDLARTYLQQARTYSPYVRSGAGLAEGLP
jgi:spermidine synthase